MGERAMDVGTVSGPRARVGCRCEAVVEALGATGHDEEVAIGRWIVEALLADLPGGEGSYVQWKHDFDVPQGPGVHEIDEGHHKIRIALNDGRTRLSQFTESEITDAWLSEEARSVIEERPRRQIEGRPDAEPASGKERIGFV
jgi:hypothetical protein